MQIFDVLLIAGAIAIIVAPDWVYNVGRREKVEVPENWHRNSKIIGIVFLLVGIVFVVLNYSQQALK